MGTIYRSAKTPFARNCGSWTNKLGEAIHRSSDLEPRPETLVLMKGKFGSIGPTICLLGLCLSVDTIGQTQVASGPRSEASSLSTSSLEAKVVALVPRYQPEQKVSGVIRIWGHGSLKIPWLKQLVSYWEEGFRRYHPDFKVQYEMHGTSSAIPALFMGVGDMAILGEEVDPAAIAAFEKVKHYPPLSIDVMTGSLDVRNFDYAQMFFVHKDNPI